MARTNWDVRAKGSCYAKCIYCGYMHFSYLDEDRYGTTLWKTCVIWRMLDYQLRKSWVLLLVCIDHGISYNLDMLCKAKNKNLFPSSLSLCVCLFLLLPFFYHRHHHVPRATYPVPI